MDAKEISRLFDRLDRELWVVTAAVGKTRGGLIATFVSQASIVPEMPRVVVGLAKQHATWKLVEASGSFALHLIDEAHVDWAWLFGLQSGANVDKFETVRTQVGKSGSPLLTDAVGWLDCRVESRMETGDRTVYLAEVLDGRLQSDAAPLTLRRLLEIAPPEKRRQLKEQLTQDARLDAEAIRASRSRS